MTSLSFEMLNSLEVKPSEGRGYGLFAKVNIPDGTVVSRESATLYGPPCVENRSDEVGINTFCETYAAASDSMRSRLNNHAYNPKQYEENLAKYDYFDKWLKGYMKRTGQYKQGESRREAVLELIKSYTIFWTNACGLPGGGAAVYSTFSRSNHSCRPNSTWRYTSDEPYHLEVVTEEDIAAGEELTVSYDNLEKKTFQERRKFLSNWGFTCMCERCTEEEYDWNSIYLD